MVAQPLASLFQTAPGDGAGIMVGNIADAGVAGRQVVQCTTVAQIKALLTLVAADITNAGATGLNLIVSTTPAAAKAVLAIASADISDASAAGKALLIASSVPNQRVALGLGAAALLDTGTAAGNIPVLDASGKLVASIIPTSAITNSMMVNMSAAGLKGATAAGPVSDLTPAQVAGMLPEATITAAGMMSASDKAKLDTYSSNDKFKGPYSSIGSLTGAVGSPAAGDWAILTHGPGIAATIAIWDYDETPPVWRDTGASGGASLGPGSVGTTELADDSVTAAKVKDNETLPVNISGNAATATNATNATNATTAASADAVAWANITGKPSVFPASAGTSYGSGGQAGGTGSGANVIIDSGVSTSGRYRYYVIGDGYIGNNIIEVSLNNGANWTQIYNLSRTLQQNNDGVQVTVMAEFMVQDDYSVINGINRIVVPYTAGANVKIRVQFAEPGSFLQRW